MLEKPIKIYSDDNSYFYSSFWIFQIINDWLFYIWIKQSGWFTENLKKSLVDLGAIKFIW